MEREEKRMEDKGMSDMQKKKIEKGPSEREEENQISLLSESQGGRNFQKIWADQQLQRCLVK